MARRKMKAKKIFINAQIKIKGKGKGRTLVSYEYKVNHSYYLHIKAPVDVNYFKFIRRKFLVKG